MFTVGHGGSDGLHAYVHSLSDAVHDMVCFEHYYNIGTEVFLSMMFAHLY